VCWCAAKACAPDCMLMSKVCWCDPKACAQDCLPPHAPLTTPLLAKSCTVFQISLCLFSLTSNFCNWANFNRLIRMKNYRVILERYSCMNKDFWWFRFFLIRLSCREIWNVQNETTKLFSVGNTFHQATMHARIFCICCAVTWIRPMVKSKPNMKKKR